MEVEKAEHVLQGLQHGHGVVLVLADEKRLRHSHLGEDGEAAGGGRGEGLAAVVVEAVGEIGAGGLVEQFLDDGEEGPDGRRLPDLLEGDPGCADMCVGSVLQGRKGVDERELDVVGELAAGEVLGILSRLDASEEEGAAIGDGDADDGVAAGPLVELGAVVGGLQAERGRGLEDDVEGVVEPALGGKRLGGWEPQSRLVAAYLYRGEGVAAGDDLDGDGEARSVEECAVDSHFFSFPFSSLFGSMLDSRSLTSLRMALRVELTYMVRPKTEPA